MATREKRNQSVAFLRSLKAGDEGVTIYQDVIDDVLDALDEARAEVERLRGAIERRVAP